jgi:hypothetical protein
MKGYYFPFLFAAVALTFPILSSACTCITPGPTALSSLDTVNLTVFRGKVVRQVTIQSGDTSTNNYIVNVTRVFKGCSFKAHENILITTGNIGMCGILLEVGGDYIISGYNSTVSAATRKKLGRGHRKIKYSVGTGLCDYTYPFDSVSAQDLTYLRQHYNQCEPCATGADCPDAYYCDTEKCVPYDVPYCSDGTPVVPCFADPCTLKPCSTDAITCIPNYCGGCNAIWIAANGTRVCLPQS